MKTDKQFIQAIEKMRCGSKEGFLIFFNKTFQYSYLWAAHYMEDQVRRNDFLSDFYPFVLLHISDLKDDTAVFPWFDQLLPYFLELWTGIAFSDQLKPVSPNIPDNSVISASANVVWKQILEKVNFPAEPKKQAVPLPIVLLAGFSLILLILVFLVYDKYADQRTSQERIDSINSENLSFTMDEDELFADDDDSQ